VNWPVSTRRQRLYVNELAAERAADIVVLLDAMSDVGPAGGSSLDLTVRGATGLVQAALSAHDRVGVVTLGGVFRWMRPDVGERQYYRLAEYILDMRRDDSVVDPDVDRIPRTALPAGALVVLFSPLLDDRAIEVVRDLRERRYPLVVVDVLCAEPVSPRNERMPGVALRLWRLDRAALRYQLADLGAVVVPWNGDGPLDGVLEGLRRMRVRA
jgi:uncharacterized protein (DUF58 family)